MTTSEVLNRLYAGMERMTRGEVVRRAIAADTSAEIVAALASVPEGEYSLDEIADIVGAETDVDGDGETELSELGIDPSDLSDDDLLRELATLHDRRDDTFRHGSTDALAQHTRRTTELENEYLRRFPDREVDWRRLRP